MVVLAFDLKNCWKYRLIVSYTMNCMDGLEARIMDAVVPFQRAERPSCDAILHKPSKIIHGQISTSCCMYMYKDNEPKCNKKSKWISHHFSFHKLYASQTAKKNDYLLSLTLHFNQYQWQWNVKVSPTVCQYTALL